MIREPALVDAVLFDAVPEAGSPMPAGEQLALWPGESSDLSDIERLNIDRSWHLLHFLLTGSADDAGHPLNFLAAGGRAVSGDLGNGPLRAFTSEEVRRLAAGLAQMTSEQLLERFDPQRMEDESVYGWPAGWLGSSRDVFDSIVREMFGQLQVFLSRGAAQGRALLVVAL